MGLDVIESRTPGSSPAELTPIKVESSLEKGWKRGLNGIDDMRGEDLSDESENHSATVDREKKGGSYPTEAIRFNLHE